MSLVACAENLTADPAVPRRRSHCQVTSGDLEGCRLSRGRSGGAVAGGGGSGGGTGRGWCHELGLFISAHPAGGTYTISTRTNRGGHEIGMYLHRPLHTSTYLYRPLHGM